MRILTHGSNINFHCSSKEMDFTKLHAFLESKIDETVHLSIGILQPEKERLEVLGDLRELHINELKEEFIFQVSYLDGEDVQRSERIFHATEDFIISHEAIFDIHDEKNGTVSYAIQYLTFWGENGEEITYFLVDMLSVEHPLACVVQFWDKVKDVGRDVDFTITGCAANEYQEVLKRLRSNQ
ncbi:hypothetical protein [Risungbinella massiliensis]|uniref:hypothetical protein n=1 Tax=Risungbinella massiliensis TaxID=1329796 RepID=UPI0005CC46C7|nr:hypothetical protein [Risungbinella massiliensis]